MSNGTSSNTDVVAHFGSDYILQLKTKPGVLFWTCPLAIDADGSPLAYHPSGSPPGLDYLANAGSPGNWWGIACTSAGVPYIQKDTDPAPTFYVSTTSLQDGGKAVSDPNRYVDSGTWPFIVLPSKPSFSPIQRLGDVACVFNNKNGKSSWAVYADVGPSNQIGEGSIALADALGLNSDPKKGGISTEDIAMVFWPGSKIAWPATQEELSTQAWFLFTKWGGFATAKIALPQINWDQFSMPEPPAPPAPPPIDEPVVTVTIHAPPGVQVKVVQFDDPPF